MANNEARVLAPEDTMAMLREKSKDGDEFYVRVGRRKSMGGPPTQVATMSGATVEHLAKPELWVPHLCGGGIFQICAYHATDASKQVGGFLPFSYEGAEMKEVDPLITKRAEWRGPPTLEFPLPAPRRERPDAMGFDFHSPPAPHSGDSATGSTNAWARPAGGGLLHRENYNGNGAASDDAYQRRQALNEAERRKVEEERLAVKEERHRDQLDGMKKAHEADLRALKMEMMALMQTSKPAGPDPMVQMLIELQKQAAEDKRAAAAQAAEDKRAAAAQLAEDRRAAEVRQAASDARFEKMMEKLTERKPEKDPLEAFEKIASIMKKNGDNGGSDSIAPMMKMMHNMAEMNTTTVGAAMDFVNMAADMQMGGRDTESPVVKAIEAGVKGLGALAKGASIRRVAPPQQPMPQVPPTFEQQATAQRVAPAPVPAQAKAPAAPAGLGTVVDQAIAAIKDKLPPEYIAKILVDHYNDPAILKLLMEFNGDFEKALQSRLNNWGNLHPENNAYLKTLFDAVEAEAISRGLIQPDDAEAQEADEPEEDAEVEGDDRDTE